MMMAILDLFFMNINKTSKSDACTNRHWQNGMSFIFFSQNDILLVKLV